MTTGLIWITCNDRPLIEKAYTSFVHANAGGYAMLGIDIKSTDGSYEYLQSKMPVFSYREPTIIKEYGYEPEDLVHLSKTLNFGIKVFQDSIKGITNVGWLHVDCDYWNGGRGEGWLKYLENWLSWHPDIGRITGESEPNPGVLGERPGQQCPWLLTARAIEALEEKYKEVFPENYLYAHVEDWCNAGRLIKLGYKVMITNSPPINHEGMGSRKNSPNRLQWEAAYGYNSQLYFQEFGTHDPLV